VSGAICRNSPVADQAGHSSTPENIHFARGPQSTFLNATAYVLFFSGRRDTLARRFDSRRERWRRACIRAWRKRWPAIIGTAGSDEGRVVVLNEALTTCSITAPLVFDQLMQLTNGKGVDVIVEMLSNVNLAKDLTVVAPRGVLFIVGSRGKSKLTRAMP